MSELGNCYILRDDTASGRIIPMTASVQDLKNGKWCCSEAHGQPGTISNVKMSKTGKHGHAKFTFNLSYPFTGQTSQEMFPGHTHLHRPEIKKFEAEVIDYDMEEEVTCLNEEGGEFYLSMKLEYVDKDGNAVGEDFMEAFNEAQETGQGLFVSILEAPVHNESHGDYFVQQIEKFQIKD